MIKEIDPFVLEDDSRYKAGAAKKKQPKKRNEFLGRRNKYYLRKSSSFGQNLFSKEHFLLDGDSPLSRLLNQDILYKNNLDEVHSHEIKQIYVYLITIKNKPH